MDESTYPTFQGVWPNLYATDKFNVHAIADAHFLFCYICSFRGQTSGTLLSNKQQTLLFLPTKTDVITRRQINPNAKVIQNQQKTKEKGNFSRKSFKKNVLEHATQKQSLLIAIFSITMRRLSFTQTVQGAVLKPV